MTQQSTRCPHHWIIETANGPSSKGVCQICGEDREFKNSIEAEPWGQILARQRQNWKAGSEEEKQP